MRLLARREHSRRELQDKLAARGYEPGLVQALVAELQRLDLVSDERFAEVYVRSRLGQGYGPLRLHQELRLRGVDEGLVKAHLDLGEAQWLDQLRRLREKRFGPEVPADRKTRLRQWRFLQYRGFTAEQIKQVLNE